MAVTGSGASGKTEPRVTVCLFHGDETPYLTYRATTLFDDGDHIVVRALWAEPAERDVGYVSFQHQDVWTEHYWRSRWYAIKEIRDTAGRRKGWYCDVARPARVEGDQLFSEDLYLDLWVSADRTSVLRLDEDEFTESGLRQRDPEAARAAERALDELELLSAQGFPEAALDLQM
jgi:hypothetical protein